MIPDFIKIRTIKERRIAGMNDRYQTPLAERYASKEMQYIFSPDMKFKTWRKLWIALAETEAELGLPITQEQIDELKAHQDDINYEDAKKRKRKFVMMLCHMCMLMDFSALRLRVSFTLEQHPAM